MVIAIVGAVAILLSALVAGSIALWNGRKERQHRELMAHLEDWRGQRDVATSLVRSSDPSERKRGFRLLNILEDDALVAQDDRQYIKQIRELATEAAIGKMYHQVGKQMLTELEANPPIPIVPGTAIPSEIAAAKTITNNMQQWHANASAVAQWFQKESIRLYGGHPPEQEAS
ncbi:hypothetical protein [Mycobacteroides abscessus]|uniref:hypothetical protein n=1 Tax=Mycobacteroides abscessus TaxID=36809 RepID=UPI0009D41395|nr:hypothetical protein [Mycobacteroides abscessus]SKQ76437.1 Uncharacterised protein [Mycobacteroides abscessus subsp. abscessus]